MYDELQINSEPWADHGGEVRLAKFLNVKIATYSGVDLSSQISSEVPYTTRNITGV
jgi:hypothetical protein